MDWSYVAGYFDGEGHAGVYRDGHWGMSFANTHLASLEAIRDFLGCGTVQARSRANRTALGTKPMYHLVIRRVEDVRRVGRELLERCIVKRPALERLLAFVEDKPSRHANHGRLAAMDRAELRRLYWDEGLSSAEIGELLGFTHSSVEALFRRNGIPRRTRGEAMQRVMQSGRWRRDPTKFPFAGTDAEEVRRLYWDEGLSTRAIGEQFGVCKEAVIGFMKRRGIPMRSRGEATKLRLHS